MDAKELYRAGKLAEAIKAMNEEVRNKPADTDRRGFLAELHCLAGNFDKADAQLDVLAQGDSQGAAGITLVRQLVRAEQARRQLFSDGRVPEFIGLPTEAMSLRLKALTEMRAGHAAAAAELLAAAEALRAPLRGTCDGAAFDELRDLDDLTADVFEVLTSTGKSYWIPFERVTSIEFRAPTRPRDLMWRRAAMAVKDGPDGEVFLPAVYVDPDGTAGENEKLARSTDWRGGEGAPMRGVGQRTLLVGDEPRPILEIKDLRIEAAAR
jgi:type VI secretion system protein ImpE